jgi:signal transduction histidine kinase
MARTRLRTKLVLSLIFTTAVLSGASLLVVQTYLGNNARREINAQISNSLGTVEQYLEQRQKLLLQSSAMSADLPIIRSLMTTRDPVTIQDTAADIWRLAESDLFLLADPDGQIMALHSSTGAFDREVARTSLSETVNQQRSRDWWYEGGRLYEIFLQPIYFGEARNDKFLGVLVSGFALDKRFAAAIANVASSDVAIRYGKVVVTSSLPADREQELSTLETVSAGSPTTKSEDIRLGGENFIAKSVGLTPHGRQPVTLTTLKSYDAATLFLRNVNQLLLGIGLVALIAGSLLMFLISHTLTRPLSRLVAGVVALEKGDFSYPLDLQRKDEVGELTTAFDTMRRSLKESQQELLQAERLATIGRMASTVSHDLRHPLTTILAYAELLSESSLDDKERNEMYQQIRSSVNNMAELIASLLEFSKAQEALQLTYGDCVETLQDTIRAVKMRPEFHRIQLTLVHEGPTQGWFDFGKLDRVFSNLLRNACEAVGPDSGRVGIVARGTNNRVEISVSDNGPGIPEKIRAEVFQPFVTYGKAEGTGLGLAVVQKIVLDHAGEVVVESTGPNGTTFKLTLPVAPSSATQRVQSAL